MNKNYVWYACYGSNLLKERFMLYIKKCNDKTEPTCDNPVIIQHELYFAKYSYHWENKGVAFIKPEKNEKAITLGRIYLITEDQFLEIQQNEGSDWYDQIIELSIIDGIPVKTFTHSEVFPKNTPGKEYFNVILAGLEETYPEMSHMCLKNYLKERILQK